MYKTSNIPRDACMPSLPPPGVPYTPALVVLLAVVVLVLEEEILVSAVGSEGDGRDTEAGEAVLEAVPAGVAALVSPGFAVGEGIVSMEISMANIGGLEGTDLRSQGSYRGWPVDSWKARMLKPVMLGLGPREAARSTLHSGRSDIPVESCQLTRSIDRMACASYLVASIVG